MAPILGAAEAFHRLPTGRKAFWGASGGLAVILAGGMETAQRLTSPSHGEMVAEAHKICLVQLEGQADRHRQEMRQELEAQFNRFMEAIKLMREE